MSTSINTWLEKALETGMIDKNQIIVVYDKNNNIEYLGKADFAPLTLWDDFKTAAVVGNEMHINERQCDTEPETTEQETTEQETAEKAKILTYDEYDAKCHYIAGNLFNNGYNIKYIPVSELTEMTINELPDNYFIDTTETLHDEYSKAFTLSEFVDKVSVYLDEMYKVWD